MKKRTLIQTIALGLALGASASAMAQATWKPTKPINLIVPWAAGGSTDQITRIAAAEIEKTLGQKIVVVNQPGASGSMGSKNAWDAPGRLHLDRRCGSRLGHLPVLGNAECGHQRLAPVFACGQHSRGQRQPVHAISKHRAISGSHENQI